MKTAFISTQSMFEAARRSMLEMQVELAKAQKEVASGRLADVGLALGHRIGDTISLRQEHSRLSTIIDTNAIAVTRLDMTQQALSTIVATAQDFLASLNAARSSAVDPTVAQEAAGAALSSLASSLNTTVAGEYIFAGINTDAQPIADYMEEPPGANRQAVAAAFLAEFGVSQSSASVANITATDLQTFLDTDFAGLFDDPGWADWSSASDQNIRSRIGTNRLVETSTNANETGFRKLAQAYTMVADLGLENLNDAASQALIDTATKLVGEAIGDLTNLQARLGTAQEEVKHASERMSVQLDILTRQINDLETVDPYEAATRVNTLVSQLETSYALTGRIQNLSLLNYL